MTNAWSFALRDLQSIRQSRTPIAQTGSPGKVKTMLPLAVPREKAAVYWILWLGSRKSSRKKVLDLEGSTFAQVGAGML